MHAWCPRGAVVAAWCEIEEYWCTNLATPNIQVVFLTESAVTCGDVFVVLGEFDGAGGTDRHEKPSHSQRSSRPSVRVCLHRARQTRLICSMALPERVAQRLPSYLDESLLREAALPAEMLHPELVSPDGRQARLAPPQAAPETLDRVVAQRSDRDRRHRAELLRSGAWSPPPSPQNQNRHRQPQAAHRPACASSGELGAPPRRYSRHEGRSRHQPRKRPKASSTIRASRARDPQVNAKS